MFARSYRFVVLVRVVQFVRSGKPKPVAPVWVEDGGREAFRGEEGSMRGWTEAGEKDEFRDKSTNRSEAEGEEKREASTLSKVKPGEGLVTCSGERGLSIVHTALRPYAANSRLIYLNHMHASRYSTRSMPGSVFFTHSHLLSGSFASSALAIPMFG